MVMKIGQLSATGVPGTRDAMHVPVCLVKTRELNLQPGDNVRFVGDNFTSVRKCGKDNRHGIVDPFVEKQIKPGDLFWIFLVPEIVGNLVHHFDIEPQAVDQADLVEADLDDGCAGCYESQEVEEEEYDDDGCAGCYN